MFILPPMEPVLEGAVRRVRSGKYARELHPNEWYNAVNIVKHLMKNHCVVQFAAMQSGKSTTMALVSLILSEIYGAKGLHTIVVSNLPRNHLKEQTTRALQDLNLSKKNARCIHPASLQEGSKTLNTLVKEIKESESPIIMFFLDECHYASGEVKPDKNGKLPKKRLLARVKELCEVAQDAGKIIKLVPTSATPFGLLDFIGSTEDPKVWGMDTVIYKSKTPPNYCGISHYFFNGQLKLRSNLSLGDDYTYNEVLSDLEFSNGVSIVRVPRGRTGEFATRFQKDLQHYDVHVVGGKTLSKLEGHKPLATQEFLDEARINVRMGKPILGLTVDCFSMGDDIGDLKPYLRVLFESGKANIACGSQGLGGRACSYNDNEGLILYMEENIANAFVDMDTGDTEDIERILNDYGVDGDGSITIKSSKVKEHKIDYTYDYKTTVYTEESNPQSALAAEIMNSIRESVYKGIDCIPRTPEVVLYNRTTFNDIGTIYTKHLMQGRTHFADTAITRHSITAYTPVESMELMVEETDAIAYVYMKDVKAARSDNLLSSKEYTKVCKELGIDSNEFILILGERFGEKKYNYNKKEYGLGRTTVYKLPNSINMKGVLS